MCNAFSSFFFICALRKLNHLTNSKEHRTLKCVNTMCVAAYDRSVFWQQFFAFLDGLDMDALKGQVGYLLYVSWMLMM